MHARTAVRKPGLGYHTTNVNILYTHMYTYMYVYMQYMSSLPGCCEVTASILKSSVIATQTHS